MTVRSKQTRQASARAKAQFRDERGRFAERRAIKQRYATVTVEGVRYEIPVDSKGEVSIGDLATRFVSTTEGGRKGCERSVPLDLARTCEEKIDVGKHIKPEDIKEWWAHPNEHDILGVDDVKSTVFDTGGATRKSSLAAQRRIGIVGATGEQRRYIRGVYDKAFTAKEIDTLSKDGMVVKVVGASDPHVRRAAGTYSADTGLIYYAKDHVDTQGTIIHEAVHRLKHQEHKTRVPGRGQHTRSFIPDLERTRSEKYRIKEEAETTAETTVRITPYERVKNPSYYGVLPGVERSPGEAFRRMDSDRKLFTGTGMGGRGLKGKRAVRTLEKKFPDSEISKLIKEE